MTEGWTRLKTRYGALVEQFGQIALYTYLGLFAATWVGFWLAIRLGFEPEGVAGGAGTVGAAYLATKLTQPVRIVATLVVTPIVAAALGHRGHAGGVPAPGSPPSTSPPQEPPSSDR